MAGSVYASIDDHLKGLMMFLLRDRRVPVASVKNGCFLQLIYESKQKKTENPFVNVIMTTFFNDIIFFHCKSVFSKGLPKRTLEEPWKNHQSMLTAFCAQDLLRVWNELFSKSPFTDF